MASIGSVFLRTTDMTVAARILQTFFTVAEPEPGATWLEVAGDVPIFVEQVAPDVELHDAEFGIRVEDASSARDELDGYPVSEIFEVAPGVKGFNVNDPRVQSLFIHE